MEPAIRKRTQSSSDTFAYFWILLLMVVFVWLVILLPNASTAPQSIESWSLEPAEWAAVVVPVTGSSTTTGEVSTTPSPPTVRTGRSRSGENHVRDGIRKPKKKSKKRDKKKNKMNGPSAVIRNKIVVNFETGIPLHHATVTAGSTKTTKTVTSTSPQVEEEEKTVVECKRIGIKMASELVVCSMTIVMILWFCNRMIQELRGRCFRSLL